MSERPQNKNLIPLTQQSPERAHEIRVMGGKASQEKRRQKQAMADLLTLYSGLPIRDKRQAGRLKRLGIPDEELTQKLLIADAVMKAAQAGNVYAVQLYMEITGEAALVGPAKENNLLQALQGATGKDINTDEISEIQHAAESGPDVVESSEV